MIRRSLLLLAVYFLAPAAAAQKMPSGTLEYDIIRDGIRIGSYILGMRRIGTSLSVDILIEVHIRALFFEVYTYRKSVREIWDRGRLIAYNAHVDDDGEKFEIKAHTTPAGLVVRGPKGTMTAPPGTLMTGYWNIATVKQTRLCDGAENKFIDIDVAFAGEVPLTINNHVHRTRLYRLRGGMERDVWYDPYGRMVQMRAIVRDGSEVITRRR